MPTIEQEQTTSPENSEAVSSEIILHDSTRNELAKQAFSRILVDEQDIARKDFNVFRSAD